jgi:hypothetical protein
MKIDRLEIQHVYFMPEKLELGILYVSEEFGTAIHLCACGQCGLQTITSLGLNGWSLEVTENKPTLRPSIGNFQFPCKSHYLVTQGKIIWC